MGCALGSLASCCACSAASCCLSMYSYILIALLMAWVITYLNKGASCSMCGKVVSCRKSSATRGIYVFQFLVVAVVAYIFSNWAQDWLKNIPGMPRNMPT